MDVKFVFFDLNYLWFDTKNVQFVEIWGMEHQTEVFYGLRISRSRPVSKQNSVCMAKSIYKN